MISIHYSVYMYILQLQEHTEIAERAVSQRVGVKEG